jgi:hypothetical protein
MIGEWALANMAAKDAVGCFSVMVTVFGAVASTLSTTWKSCLKKAVDPGATICAREYLTFSAVTGSPLWKMALYPVHVRIRKSFGEMTRKLSDTASQ